MSYVNHIGSTQKKYDYCITVVNQEKGLEDGLVLILELQALDSSGADGDAHSNQRAALVPKKDCVGVEPAWTTHPSAGNSILWGMSTLFFLSSLSRGSLLLSVSGVPCLEWPYLLKTKAACWQHPVVCPYLSSPLWPPPALDLLPLPSPRAAPPVFQIMVFISLYISCKLSCIS